MDTECVWIVLTSRGPSWVQFVNLMRYMLPLRPDSDAQARLISDLVELFSQIDFNGDGSLEWLEFTSFISEAAAVQRFSQERVQTVRCREGEREPTKCALPQRQSNLSFSFWLTISLGAQEDVLIRERTKDLHSVRVLETKLPSSFLYSFLAVSTKLGIDF